MKQPFFYCIFMCFQEGFMRQRMVSVTDPTSNPFSVIITLAWPIFLEQVLVSLVQSIDTAMVGSLGANATASVAISQNPINLINSVILALGVGFTTMIARAVGAGQYDYSKLLIRQSIVVVIALGIPLSALCFALSRQIPIWMGAAPEILDDAQIYIRIIAFSMLFRGLLMVLTAIYRGFGDSRTPMLINVAINTLNVLGNYLLIYDVHDVTLFGHTFSVWGANLGVAGAALSTTCSQTLGSLTLLLMCFLPRSGPMRISVHDSFRPSRDTLQEVFRVSLPVMFERFTISGAFVMTSSIIATLGTVSLAANSLAAQAESLSFMPGFAFGTAATTLVGQSLGANREDLARKYVRLSGWIGSIVMLFMSFLLFILSENIIALFTPDEQVIVLGGQLLKILAFIQVPQMLAMVYSGALKGAGDTKSPFLITLFSMWGVRILGSILVVRVFHKDLRWVCAAMCLDNIVRFFLYLYRYLQGKWVTAYTLKASSEENTAKA
jgi:putative MATE family efflux protein